jgi:hypothetical protein
MMKNGFHILYIREGQVIVPVTADTTSGWMDIEPVTIINCDDAETITRTVRATIVTGNPKGRGYLRDEFPPPVVLAATNTRSWSQFSKGTASIGWEVSDEQCAINKIANMGLPGKAGYEPAIIATFPRSVSLDAFVAAIVREVCSACAGNSGDR